MTLHGDRVTCDVQGCEASTTDMNRPLFLSHACTGWKIITAARSGEICDICPTCRARYTDEQLREMLARKETT